MVVIIANDLPPAVRGIIKLWFVEPKPNVFVSGITDNIAEKVTSMLIQASPLDSGMIIFEQTNIPPFFKIHTKGGTDRSLTRLTGYTLVKEKSADLSDLNSKQLKDDCADRRPFESSTGE